MRTFSLAAFVALLTLATGAARGDTTQTPFRENPAAAFAETDQNRDSLIDREEFHQRMVDVFYMHDQDKNGSLSATEFEAMDTPETFTAMDRNKNGVVSMYEFIAYRFHQFDDADTGEDGTLTLMEVETYLNR